MFQSASSHSRKYTRMKSFVSPILHSTHENQCLPRIKLQTQKKPCIGYNFQVITSCKYGVTSPTKKLNAQFVAVERETPFARTVRGRIFDS